MRNLTPLLAIAVIATLAACTPTLPPVTPGASSDHLAIQRGARLDLRTDRMNGLLGATAPGQQEGMDRLASDLLSGRVAAVARFQNT